MGLTTHGPNGERALQEPGIKSLFLLAFFIFKRIICNKCILNHEITILCHQKLETRKNVNLFIEQ